MHVHVVWNYVVFCRANILHLSLFRAIIRHLSLFRASIRHLSLVCIQAIPPLSQAAIHQLQALQVSIQQVFPEITNQDLEWVTLLALRLTHPTLQLPAIPQVQYLAAIHHRDIRRLSQVDIHPLSSRDILDHILQQVALMAVRQRRMFHANNTFFILVMQMLLYTAQARPYYVLK